MYERFLAKIRDAYKRTGLKPARNCWYEDGRGCPLFALYCDEHGISFDDLVDDEEEYFRFTGDVAERACDWAWSRFGQGRWLDNFIAGFDGRTDADTFQVASAAYRIGRQVAEALLGKA